MTGLYIHVPFCGSRCIYCDFFSTTMLERRGEYVNALCRELQERRTDDLVPTIYFGGGTPSMLDRGQLESILYCIHHHYDVAPDAEITLEANPDDVTVPLLGGLPINRLSMGVQSFDDDRLRFLHRRHTARQAVKAVETALSCGIANVSLDLIYGLPGQTMEEWRRDVARALELPLTHLSSYALSYEPYTRLYGMRERGEIKEVGDELSREMYYHLCDACARAGLVHYEISNFARPGYESRHNSSYWTGVPYLGFGPGAHSYDGGRMRRSNPANLDCWLRGEHDEERLTRQDCFNERLFLSLRTLRGLDLKALERDFGTETRTILPVIDNMVRDGLLVRLPRGVVRLDRQAIFTSDDIISNLFLLDGV